MSKAAPIRVTASNANRRDLTARFAAAYVARDIGQFEERPPRMDQQSAPSPALLAGMSLKIALTAISVSLQDTQLSNEMPVGMLFAM